MDNNKDCNRKDEGVIIRLGKSGGERGRVCGRDVEYVL